MTDDPREILKATGVECWELDDPEIGWESFKGAVFGDGVSRSMAVKLTEKAADSTILALAKLVAKYRVGCAYLVECYIAPEYGGEWENTWEVNVEQEYRRWEERQK